MKKTFLKLTTLLIPIIGVFLLQGCGKETKPSVEEPSIPPTEVGWTFDTNSQINSSIVAFENTVIFGSSAKKIYSVDTTTQKEVWSKSVDKAVTNTLLLDGNTLICSTQTTCYALDAKTGEELWKYTGDGKITDIIQYGYSYHSPSPILYKDKVLFPTVSGNVYCLNKETGHLEWQYKNSETADIRATPALLGDALYLADLKGNVYGFDLNTQKTLWNVTNGTDIAHGITAYNDMVFVGGRNAKVVALDAKTGSSKWEYSDTSGSWFSGDMQIVNDVLYVPGSDNQSVLAFPYDTGEMLTRYPTKANIFSQQLITNDSIFITYGNVYSNNIGGIVSYKLNDTSNPLLQVDINIPSYSTPCILNNTLYFGGTDGKLYAINL